MTQKKIDIRIPGYQILRQLGQGGMATVYLAMQESMEREVALKIMLPALAATDPSFSERFVREAKIIAKLSHPNVNTVHDVGVAGPYHYFSMEYIKGGDLKSRIKYGKMAPKMAFAIVRQIASALDFAHSKGYVHRDVKPENVLFRDNGTAVLTDFGIAKANDVATNMTNTGVVIGTPRYMSPEQAKGQALDGRSDLYSLGIVLFEALTGDVPFTGDSAVSVALKHVTEPVPRMAPPLDVYQPLLEKFLAKDPAHRFQSGKEAITGIEAYENNATPPPGTISGPIAADRTIVMGPGAATSQTLAVTLPKSRRKLYIATALLVPLIAAAVYFGRLRQPTIPTPAVATTTPSITKPSAAETPAPTKTVDTNAQQVEQLLAQADAAARAGQYFEPGETAAVSRYRRVLELDRGNSIAARALNEIAGRFIGQAERAIENQQFEQAEAFLRQAEQADSGHPLLFSRRLALKEQRKQLANVAATRAEPRVERAAPRPAPSTEIQRPVVAPPAPTVANIEDLRARELRQREQQLQTLLGRFDDLLSRPSLTAARVGQARDLIGQATHLAPDDARTRALPNRVADAYLALATARADQKEYTEAETLIQRGLDASPDHRDLRLLRTQIAEKKNSTPKRQTFGSF